MTHNCINLIKIINLGMKSVKKKIIVSEKSGKIDKWDKNKMVKLNQTNKMK